MKKCILVMLSLILWSLGSAQTIYDTYTGFTTPTTPVLPPTEIHPKLYFDASQVSAIKNRFTINSFYASRWSSINSNINTFKTRDASTQSVNNRPRMAKYCAFGWIMNADTTARRKAIEALLIAFDNVPRTTNPADFDGDYDEIYRATWLQNYCEAYDWVYSQLSPTQDSIIRFKLTEETRILRNHMVDSTRYAPRPHNHRSKPAYGIATAALTFSSDPRASGWLQFALTQLNTVTKYQYSFDGIYREGGHYDLYSMVNGIPFLWHYKNVSGVDLFPYYKPVFEWPIKVRMGQGWIPLFEDSFLKPWPGHIAASAYTTTPTELHTSASLASVMQWSFFKTNIFTANYTGATNDVTWDIEEYLLYDSTIPEVMPNVSPTINMGGGQTIFRKNWNYNDRANRYLVFHGVAEADNHNHPDNLSFVIEAENSIMATAPGYGPAGYSDPRRNTWYITPEANNLITVDGTAPKDSATNITPPTQYFIDSDFFDHVEKKGYYSNGAVWKRAISFPRQNYWVVRDIVNSSTSRISRLYLHCRGNLTTNGINAQWTTVSDKYGSQAIFDTYNISSGGSAFSTSTGWLSLFWGEEVSAPYITLQNQDTVSMFMSVLYPRATTTTAPTVVNYSANGLLGFTVTHGDTNDIHISKKNNQPQSAAGVTTNGNYAWLALVSGKHQSISVVNGDSLLWNGNIIYKSSRTMTFAANFVDGNKVIAVGDSFSTSVSIQLKLAFPAINLLELLYNNQPKNFIILGDSLISFSTSSTIGSIISVNSGNWNSPTTWSGNSIPTLLDNVTVSTAHTVTLDINNAVCNNLTVNGKLYFRNDGTASGLSVYGNINVNSGGELKVNTRSPAGAANSYVSHSLTVFGNLTNNGILDMRAGSNSGGTSNGVEITFAGSTNSTISVTAYSTSNNEFNSIIINKTGGAKVLLNSDVVMCNNTTTGPAILNFINGMVETGPNKLIVLSTSASGVVGASSTKYVRGFLGRGLSTSAAVNRIFEVGDENGYRPITVRSITPIGSGGYLVARVVPGNANNNSSFSGDIDKVSAVRYYQLTYNKGTSDSLFFNLGRISPAYGTDDGVSEGNTDLRVAYSTNNRLSWMGIGPINHTTNLSTSPTTISSDTINPNLQITNGGTFFAALARKAGTTTNSLESGLMYSSISGRKVNDVEGDSLLDGNSGIPGWVVKLYKDGILVDRKITDQNGNYTFTGILPAVYTVEESLTTGWLQTYPRIGMMNVSSTSYGENSGVLSYTFTINAGANITGIDFGNCRYGAIIGFKYYDTDGDSSILAEPTIGDWVLKLYKNGLLQQRAATDENGEYVFDKVLPGIYTVEESLKVNWYQTYPRADVPNVGSVTYGPNAGERAYIVSVSPGEIINGINFGNSDRICIDVCVQTGWNMIGVPLIRDTMARLNLFPSSNSSAFYYSGGYLTQDTLVPGKGYWLKFLKPDTFTICGKKINSDSIAVKTGWNLISVYDQTVSVSEVTSNPVNLLTSGFYGYSNGYQSVTSLLPGKGYWIKVNQDGILILPENKIKYKFNLK